MSRGDLDPGFRFRFRFALPIESIDVAVGVDVGGVFICVCVCLWCSVGDVESIFAFQVVSLLATGRQSVLDDILVVDRLRWDTRSLLWQGPLRGYLTSP